MKYSYFTVGLPESTPEQAATLLKKHGYDGIEWRVTRDNPDLGKIDYWQCNRCTLQDHWTDAQFHAIAKMTRDIGLATPVLGSYAAARNLDTVKRIMEIANIIGAPMFRVNFTPLDHSRPYPDAFKEQQDDFAKVVEAAKSFRVKPLAEIHMGNILPSVSAAYRFIGKFDPAEAGVIHDAGNMVYEGYESYKNGIELLGPYLAHVHIKNAMPVSEPATGPQHQAWKVIAAPLRKGQVDFKTLLTALKNSGYNRWLSIEDFSTESPQEEKVRDNIAFLKEIEAGL